MTHMIAHRRSRNPFAPTMPLPSMIVPFDPFFGMRPPAHMHAKPLSMRTDIKESDEGFEIAVDLPGFGKDDIKAELKDGRLFITAHMEKGSEGTQGAGDGTEDSKNSSYLRQERFSGTCRRSFFIGDEVEPNDIKASFENGVLMLNIPKKTSQDDDSRYVIPIG